MPYITKSFFVKPNSTFPAERIDEHFIERCNYYQNIEKSDYIIGMLLNARTNELIAYFSDHTKDTHGMDVNKLVVVAAEGPSISLPGDLLSRLSKLEEKVFSNMEVTEISNFSIVVPSTGTKKVTLTELQNEPVVVT